MLSKASGKTKPYSDRNILESDKKISRRKKGLTLALNKLHNDNVKVPRDDHFISEYNREAERKMYRDIDGDDSDDYKRGGKTMHHSDCTCKMCSGGRAKRKSGGRVGKGKTTVNIMISPQQGGQQQPPMLGAGVGMGMPPGIPQMPPPMPPAAPPMMPPGAPPMMSPAGAGPGLGALGALMAGRPGMSAPVPPMRKSGGRVKNWMPKHQQTDFGSGSGLGRLKKAKFPPADGTP